jgi:NitT/TauT family transport system substrate-binding protein
MKNRLSLKLIIFVVLTAFLSTGDVAFSASQDKPEDLSLHPVYSGYVFGKDEKVIDFATQPLAATMGVIAELMKRDRILRKELAGRGIEIRFHPFNKGPDINFFIRSGDIEIATLGDAPAIAIASTYDAILAALTKQGYSSLVARERMQINELKGRKVGYPAGTTAHYNLLIALHAAGMKESDIVHADMEVNELPEALEKRKIDAFAAWEPIPSATLAKHREYVVVQKFLNETYLTFTKSFVKNHPGETSLLIASYLRALRWMKKSETNLMTAAEWYLTGVTQYQKKPSTLSVAQVASLTSNEILKIAPAPYIPLNDFEKEGFISKTFEFMKAKGTIPDSATWEKLRNSLNRSIMEDVLSNTVKYRLDKFDYETGKEAR